MNKTIKVVLAVSLAVILTAVGFIGGYATSQLVPGQSVASAASGQSALGAHVEEVNRLLQREALVPPSETSATAGAINGMIEASGDKYGMYFDPEHLKAFEEESNGEFGGIGVVLGEKDGTAYVVEVYKGTPAEKAGIKAGDIFTVIGGVKRDKWTTEEVIKRVRGKEGTKVTLTMTRPPKGAPAGVPAHGGKEYTFDVTRATIKVPNIESELKGTVGYVRLYQFNAASTDDIAKAIKELEGKGAKSFVLDLRDNPGGLLDQAVSVTSLFVPSGVVVRVDERNRKPVDYRTTGDTVTDAPLVVLINENSASASEIVSGALQDYGRATLVGVKSFGKGSVQSIRDTSFGGAVKFTTAHYLTPKNRAINGKGLQPDVKVEMDREKQDDPKTDIQLIKALELAKKAQK